MTYHENVNKPSKILQKLKGAGGEKNLKFLQPGPLPGKFIWYVKIEYKEAKVF